jgi:uncharacterized membrane protein
MPVDDRVLRITPVAIAIAVIGLHLVISTTFGLLMVSLMIIGCLALTGYTVHRYELVVFNIV